MPKIPNPPQRANVSFKPVVADYERLQDAAKRYARGKVTRALEYGVRLLDRPCSESAQAALGLDSPDYRVERIAQALEAFAAMVAKASEDNARTFSREDWGMLAECTNGLLWEPTCSGPQVILAAEVHDGHHLNGYGETWYGDKAKARVAKLVQRLRELDDAHAWAVVVAVQGFWDNPEVEMESEWWLPENRV